MLAVAAPRSEGPRRSSFRRPQPGLSSAGLGSPIQQLRCQWCARLKKDRAMMTTTDWVILSLSWALTAVVLVVIASMLW
jgi:hypothetical protein